VKTRATDQFGSSPNSEVTVSAPIFAFAANSNEVFGVLQSIEKLQIVEQHFCDREFCENNSGCRQVIYEARYFQL
jgi:hypothetical protein